MSAERPFQLLPALQPYISFIRPLLRVVIVGALYTVAALLPDFAPAAGMMGAVDFVRVVVECTEGTPIKTQLFLSSHTVSPFCPDTIAAVGQDTGPFATTDACGVDTGQCAGVRCECGWWCGVHCCMGVGSTRTECMKFFSDTIFAPHIFAPR